jgi:hypothetical protein
MVGFLHEDGDKRQVSETSFKIKIMTLDNFQKIDLCACIITGKLSKMSYLYKCGTRHDSSM